MNAQLNSRNGRRWSGAAALVILIVALVTVLPESSSAAEDGPVPAAVSALLEVEPNDTPETANPIAHGRTYVGDIDPGCEDEDYFVFHGSAGDHIQAIVNNTSVLSPQLFLADGQRALSHSSDFGGRYGYARLLSSLPADGDYYLRVAGFNEEGGDGCDGSYTLQLSEASFVSVTQNATAGGLSFAKSDIVAYDQTTNAWEMLYDLSDVGLENNVGAFFLLNDSLWFAPVTTFVPSPKTTGWVTQHIEPQDLAVLGFGNFGPETDGRFYFYDTEYGSFAGLDGSDVGLTTNGEAIDAAAVDAHRRVVISTRGNCSVPGVPACADEDLIVFNPTSLGTDTAGDWEMLFDGSDIGLGPNDIRAVWLNHDNDDVYFALESGATIGGLAATPDDVVLCSGGTRGNQTSCETLEIDWSGGDHGLTKPLDGLVFGVVNESPQDSGIIDLTNWALPPAEGLTFNFTGDLGQFTMGVSEGKQFLLPKGDYDITVQPQEDWDLDIVCRVSGAPDDSTVFDHATRTVTFHLDLGAWIDCEVYNFRPVWYVSAPSSGLVDGIPFDRMDILAYDPGTDRWETIFDGSDANIAANVTAFSKLWPYGLGGILMSFSGPQTVRSGCDVDSFTARPQDVVRWVDNDYFEYALDGSDVGLAQSSEAIDAIGIAPDGRLLISTTGLARVPGAVAQDEDILAFQPERWATCGQETVGTWALYFDGSTIPGLAQEDVVGLAQDARGDLYLTLQDSFNVGGVKCGPSCVIVVHPDGTVEKAWDAKASRFPLKLDGIDVPYTQGLKRY